MANTIEWKPVIIGIIIAVILNILSGQNLWLPAFLLAGIAVGFMVGGTWKKGVINGVILGVIGGIISIVLLLIIFASQGAGSEIFGLLAISFVLYLIFEIILAIVGGILGFFIVAESEKNPIEGSVEE